MVERVDMTVRINGLAAWSVLLDGEVWLVGLVCMSV